jgi:hypothetical protein
MSASRIEFESNLNNYLSTNSSKLSALDPDEIVAFLEQEPKQNETLIVVRETKDADKGVDAIECATIIKSITEFLKEKGAKSVRESSGINQQRPVALPVLLRHFHYMHTGAQCRYAFVHFVSSSMIDVSECAELKDYIENGHLMVVNRRLSESQQNPIRTSRLFMCNEKKLQEQHKAIIGFGKENMGLLVSQLFESIIHDKNCLSVDEMVDSKMSI